MHPFSACIFRACLILLVSLQAVVYGLTPAKRKLGLLAPNVAEKRCYSNYIKDNLRWSVNQTGEGILDWATLELNASTCPDNAGTLWWSYPYGTLNVMFNLPSSGHSMQRLCIFSLVGPLEGITEHVGDSVRSHWPKPFQGQCSTWSSSNRVNLDLISTPAIRLFGIRIAYTIEKQTTEEMSQEDERLQQEEIAQEDERSQQEEFMELVQNFLSISIPNGVYGK